MEKDNYSAEALKERGHGVIEESKWENFDKMVDNNCKSWMGLRYVAGLLLCNTLVIVKSYHEYHVEED